MITLRHFTLPYLDRSFSNEIKRLYVDVLKRNMTIISCKVENNKVKVTTKYNVTLRRDGDMVDVHTMYNNYYLRPKK